MSSSSARRRRLDDHVDNLPGMKERSSEVDSIGRGSQHLEE